MAMIELHRVDGNGRGPSTTAVNPAWVAYIEPASADTTRLIIGATSPRTELRVREPYAEVLDMLLAEQMRAEL